MTQPIQSGGHHIGDAHAEGGGQAAHGGGPIYQGGPESRFIFYYGAPDAGGPQRYAVAQKLSWWDLLLGPLLVMLGTGIMQLLQQTVFPTKEYNLVVVPVEVFAVAITIVGYVDIIRHRERHNLQWFLGTLPVFAALWGLWISLLTTETTRPPAIGVGYGIVVFSLSLVLYDWFNLYRESHPGSGDDSDDGEKS